MKDILYEAEWVKVARIQGDYAVVAEAFDEQNRKYVELLGQGHSLDECIEHIMGIIQELKNESKALINVESIQKIESIHDLVYSERRSKPSRNRNMVLDQVLANALTP